MAETSTTTYMSLTLPTPGERLGPTLASDLNTALTAIDAHDHASVVSAISFSASSTNISTDTTVSVSDDLSYYPVDASGTGSITITLPSAPSGGRFFIFKDISGNAATKNILIRASGTSQMVDGKKSTDTPGGYLINSNYGGATVISRGNSLDFDVI